MENSVSPIVNLDPPTENFCGSDLYSMAKEETDGNKMILFLEVDMEAREVVMMMI